MGVTVRRASEPVERINAASAEGDGSTQRRACPDRLELGVGERLALAPHAGASGEAVIVRTTVVAARAVIVLLEEGVDERAHPIPSAFARWT